MLRNALAWRGDESLEDRLRTLEQSLTLSQMPLDEAVPLMAPLLGLPVPERYASLGLLPDAQRKRTIATLVTWLSGAARLQPVVLVVEDLHWADPSSLELLELLVREVANARALLDSTDPQELPGPSHLLPHHAQPVTRLSAVGSGDGETRGEGENADARTGRRVDRAHGRCAALRRGAEHGHAGGRRPTHRARAPPPEHVARLARRSPRSTRLGQGGGADRSGTRPALLL